MDSFDELYLKPDNDVFQAVTDSLDSLIVDPHQQATNKPHGTGDENSYGSSEHIMASIAECHFKELKRRQEKV
jgi:hypothetical protein